MVASAAPLTDPEIAVWRVDADAATLFVAGTVHRLGPWHYPLPAPYRLAYQQSGALLVETDIDTLQSAAVRREIAIRSRLPNGEGLENLLAPSTAARLRDYCTQTGFPGERLERLKPGPAMMALLGAALDALGISAPGIDEHFYRRARADDKPITALESTAQQIDQLLALDQGDADAFVRHSIEELDGLQQADGAAFIDALLAHGWHCPPAVRQALLVERNRAWLPELRACLARPGTRLALVGAAHLTGPAGLLAMLRDAGHRPQRLGDPAPQPVTHL